MVVEDAGGLLACCKGDNQIRVNSYGREYEIMHGLEIETNIRGLITVIFDTTGHINRLPILFPFINGRNRGPRGLPGFIHQAHSRIVIFLNLTFMNQDTEISSCKWKCILRDATGEGIRWICP